jgi:ferredoxin
MQNGLIDSMNVVALGVGLIIGLLMILVALISYAEGEPRAFRRALAGAIVLPLPFIAAGLVGLSLSSGVLSLVLLIASIAAAVLILLPLGNNYLEANDTPSIRFDERDVMFSRRTLKPGTERFDAYYEDKPEVKELDDKWRSRPGLMAKGALYHDPISAASANASFDTVEAFHSILDREESRKPKTSYDPEKMSRYIKRWSLKLGAVSSGITVLEEYHQYSYIGRGDRYGEPIVMDHDFAIAVTVEMNKESVDSAPYSPEIIETAQQYLNAGAIAVQIAEFIRHLGYSARAHIDGSYWVICPLVARDAGLGEIGRMGLLMTPELGPRVRLAVVTTNMPLKVDERKRDLSVIDFCERCQKCADVCPSNSIQFGDREEIDGVMRWKINAESCFTYWCTVGTDCGLCMRSCPYSHPNSLMHNVVRSGLKHSSLFRRVALSFDDLLYGRIPVRAEIPDWMDIGINDQDELSG